MLSDEDIWFTQAAFFSFCACVSALLFYFSNVCFENVLGRVYYRRDESRSLDVLTAWSASGTPSSDEWQKPILEKSVPIIL